MTTNMMTDTYVPNDQTILYQGLGWHWLGCA